MYIRQTSQKLRDGTRVRYLQLAHKIRDPKTGSPKDEVLYHFGREDKLDKDQLKRLVKSLTRFLEPADRLVAEATLDCTDAALELEKSLSFGGSYVLDKLWRRLGIQETLKKLLETRSHKVDIERMLFALVANRALAPRSKLGLEKWAGRKVSIDGLDEVAVHNLYRAMDFLVDHHDEIQRNVFFSVATLLNLEVDLLFFDTTSSYFEVEDEDDDEHGDGLRRHGHSKDRRRDRPQVVIGLAVTRDGIPVRCWVLPGNTSDASIVDDVQKDLAGWRLNRVVWVLDRGFSGEDQRLALQRGGGQVIIGEKLRGSAKLNHEALQRRGRYKTVRENLEVKEVMIERGSEKRRFVVVRNPKEAVRDAKRRQAIIARLQAEIDRLNDGRRRRGCKHSKQVCVLKTHPTMGRFVRELKSGELRIDKAKLKEEAKLDGKYLLSTTDLSLSAEDVALGYKQLWQVERAFRTLKTTLELRPMYHRLPDRIRAHVLLCWLALLLIRVIEREVDASWDSIREDLQEIMRAWVRNKDGIIQLTNRLNSKQRSILKSLSIKEPRHIEAVAAS